jgi:hypothetical protein
MDFHRFYGFFAGIYDQDVLQIAAEPASKDVDLLFKY